MPRIPNEILDCTFFLYQSKEDALARKKTGGTGFFICMESEVWKKEITYFYAVTNWHVAVRDGCSVIRTNTIDGQTDIIEHGPEDWIFDKDGDDLAIMPINLNPSVHAAKPIPINLIYKKEDFVNGPEANSIGLGDDVFMLGRFIDIDNTPANSPTARFGNISSMPHPVKQAGPTSKLKDSYCLDMHSRPGYSGSPVFVYRTPGTNLAHTLDSGIPDLERSMLFLLGVHFGHFSEDLKITGAPNVRVTGSSGMTGVIQSCKILELLNMNKLKKRRADDDFKWGEIFKKEKES